MGTQKNRLDETILLSTQNICLKLKVRKYLKFYTEIFCLFKPVATVLGTSILQYLDKECLWRLAQVRSLFPLDRFLGCLYRIIGRALAEW